MTKDVLSCGVTRTYKIKIDGPKNEVIFEGEVIKGDSSTRSPRSGAGESRFSAGLWIKRLMKECHPSGSHGPGSFPRLRKSRENHALKVLS